MKTKFDSRFMLSFENCKNVFSGKIDTIRKMRIAASSQ